MPVKKNMYFQRNARSVAPKSTVDQSNVSDKDTKDDNSLDDKQTDVQQQNSTRQKSNKLRGAWATLSCCTSVSALLQVLLAFLLLAGLVLAIVLPIWLTSRGIASTTTTTDITNMNNNNSVINNTTMVATVGTNATTMVATIGTNATTMSTTMVINSTSSSMTSTNASTTSSSGSPTTSNICTGSYTYVTQLLYLNMTSTLSWTQYKFNYTAPSVTTARLTFSFRNDPAFWYLDDVSITNSSGQELLSNGDFEQGTLVDWIYCNPNNATFSGYVTGLTWYSGGYSYKDGSINTPDYLSQTFDVLPNNKYTIKFWLSSTSSSMTFAWITISA